MNENNSITKIDTAGFETGDYQVKIVITKDDKISVMTFGVIE